MIFKRIGYLGGLLLAALSVSVRAHALADSCDRLTISGPAYYAPFSALVDNGELRGAGIELAKTIAADMGIPATIPVYKDWPRLLARHKVGAVDIVVALYKTRERAGLLHFLGSYAAEKTVVIARKDNPIEFEDHSDLIGYVGAIAQEDSRGEQMDLYIKRNYQIVWVPNPSHMLRLFAARRIDYALIGEVSEQVPGFNYRAPENGLYVLPKEFSKEPVYMSFSKRSKCSSAVDEFSRRLNEMVKSGVAEKFLERAGTLAE